VAFSTRVSENTHTTTSFILVGNYNVLPTPRAMQQQGMQPVGMQEKADEALGRKRRHAHISQGDVKAGMDQQSQVKRCF
jgi:hypothetical protein